jgi:hypothetical protein
MKRASMNVFAKIVASGSVAFLLAGCLVNMGRNNTVDPRRLFLNDVAANDSLPSTFLKEGLIFVLQPGDSYRLRLKSAAVTDSVVFYARNTNGEFSPLSSIGGTDAGGGFRSFAVAPSKSTPDYYLAFLRAANGGTASLPDSVRLVVTDTTPATQIAVRLLMVRGLSGLTNDSLKAEYAQAFHTELRSVYAAYGITIDTSTVIVEPTGTALTLVFNGDFVSLPGERRTDGINMYLVDSIRNEGSAGMVVGFAPREAFDLAASGESRIVLNVRGGSAASMAVTAAHEMGHFIGLRHTTATTTDRGFDEDESNRDDGFASTPYCSSLEKRAASPAEREEIIRGPRGRAYCMRVTGTALTCGCSDAPNLMFPYACNPAGQKSLGADQQKFVRTNLRVLK